jgi:hypothetical protein
MRAEDVRTGKSLDEIAPVRFHQRVGCCGLRKKSGGTLRMARKIVIITLFLWLLFLLYCVAVARMPGLSTLPLYGLYPGAMASGETNYSPTAINAWAIGAGIVFLSLAVAGVVWKNRAAAVAFIVLLILSAFVSCARMVNALSGLH